ncbi:hypothetical protein D9M71_370370 [compost metagenome]
MRACVTPNPAFEPGFHRRLALLAEKNKLFEFKGLPAQSNESIIASIENEVAEKLSVFKGIAILLSCFLKELYMLEIACSRVSGI